MKYCLKCGYPNPDSHSECFKCSEPTTNASSKPLWTCGKCKLLVDTQAIRCPLCNSPKPTTPTQSLITTIVLLAIVALIWVAVLHIPSPEPTSPDKQETEMDMEGEAIDAFLISQDFVRDNLKAPATASFPDYSRDAMATYGPHAYQVTSYVDSENSFSAKLRGHYVCKVRRVGDKWILDDLQFQEADDMQLQESDEN